MTVATVGIREFRAGLSDFIDADQPTAVTRHGRTVGFFIPTKTDLSAERAAFMQAASRLNELLGDIDVDDIINELDTLRHEARA